MTALIDQNELNKALIERAALAAKKSSAELLGLTGSNLPSWGGLFSDFLISDILINSNLSGLNQMEVDCLVGKLSEGLKCKK